MTDWDALQEAGDRLPPRAELGRWDAFTEPELCVIDMAFDRADMPHMTIVQLKREITAELDRRASDPPR